MRTVTEQGGGRWRLWRRRELIVPTWRGWCGLGILCWLMAVLAVRWTYPFFAVTDRVPARVLVVEGWAPDYAMAIAARECQSGAVDRVYVTGVPLDQGAPLSEYRTYAGIGAAVLLRLGLSTNQVRAVPAERVRQDRTYTSAVFLARFLEAEGERVDAFNVLSMGAHARRSRLLFQKAFGKQVKVGVISVPVEDFDPDRWYASSAGVRGVISELLAYGYARFLFWPKPVAARGQDGKVRGELEPARAP